jgi:hypothetical protein
MAGLANNFAKHISPVPARAAVPGTTEPPTIMEAFRIGRQDQLATDNFNSDSRTIEDAYSPLLEAVNAARVKEGKPALVNPGRGSWLRGPGTFSSTDYGLNLFKAPWKGVTTDEQQKIIFAEIARLRGADPAFLKGIDSDPEKYLAGIYAAKAATARANAGKLQRGERGTGVAAFAGAVAGSFQDPVTILSTPFGGPSKSIATAFLKNGAINAAFGAAILPEVIDNRSKIGQETSAGDIMTELVTDFVAGGALAAAGKYGGDKFEAWRSNPAREQAAALKQILKHVPEDQRAGITSIDDIPDELWPDITEGLIGKENMTPDERAAVHVQRREAEIDAINPFVANEPGKQAHHDGLASAMQAIMDGVPERPPVAAPVGRSRVRSDLQGSSAISSRTVSATPARERLKNTIGHVESGNSNSAKNPLSSATGKYQFIRSTWVSYYKRRFGSAGLTDDQIAAKRNDPRLQETLMDDLLADNARFLRHAGQAETSGNLYLVHFAGQGGAERLFNADPNASARDVLGKAVVDANPFLANMTARDVIRWAANKMQDAPPLGAGERTVLRDGENPLAQSLQAEIDRIDADQAALAGQADEAFGDAPELGRASDDGAFDDIEPVFVEQGDEIPLTEAEITAPEVLRNPETGRVSQGSIDGAPLPEVLELVESLRDLVKNSKIPLNDFERLGRKLEASAANVEQAMQQLHRRGEIFLTRGRIGRKGRKDVMPRFQRHAKSSGASDIFKFLARNGGIRDASAAEGGGHRLATMGLPEFIPGAGPLIRKNGMPLDRARELAWEAGYIGKSDDDGISGTTVADLLEYFDEVLRGNDAGKTIEEWADEYAASRYDVSFDDQLPEFSAEMYGYISERGYEWTDDDYITALQLFDGEFDSTIDRVIRSQIDDALVDAMFETGDPRYSLFDPAEEFEANARALENQSGKDGGAGTGGDGQATVEGNPREGEPSAQEFDSQERAAIEFGQRSYDDASIKLFDDPAGEGAAMQIDSLEHDLSFRHGEIGGKLAEKEIVLTATGRETTPFPKLNWGSNRKAINTTKRVDQWLIENARAEAKARGDDFNSLQFDNMDLKNLSPSDKDSAELYLFGNEQPPVLRNFLREIDTGDAPQTDFAAPTADQARTALELQGEGRKQSDATQKAPGSDGGLFDDGARAETEFRFEEDGAPATFQSVMDEFAEEEAAIKAARECL